MDKAMIAEHLTLAERHVAEGERHIERQRETIRELERDGHDLTAAMARVRSRLYRVRERHAAAKFSLTRQIRRRWESADVPFAECRCLWRASSRPTKTVWKRAFECYSCDYGETTLVQFR